MKKSREVKSPKSKVDVRCPSCDILAESPCDAEMIADFLWIASCQNCGGMYSLSFETECYAPAVVNIFDDGVWRIRRFA